MNREERAKQFMPFDAVKGLGNALRLKEYEHERVQKGDLSEEKIGEISKVLLDIKKGGIVKIKYFEDGHYFEIDGASCVDYVEQIIKIDKKTIKFDDIFEIFIKKS